MRVDGVLMDPAYPALKAYVLQSTGLNYYIDKDEDLATRILRRIEHVAAMDCAGYLQLLTESPHATGEFSCLVGELTIGETYFFRQREHFDLLERVILPERIEANLDSRTLRMWSAGCATGAEPHTISLLLQMQFAHLWPDWKVSILATDLDLEFLAKARDAIYSESALRETAPEIRDGCFDRSGRHWKLRSKFRQHVEYRQHNLVSPGLYPGEDGSGFDVIFCRNVLIYFSPATVREVVDRLYRCLKPGGWLLVGHAEPDAEVFSKFDLVLDDQVSAYRKPGAGATASGHFENTFRFTLPEVGTRFSMQEAVQPPPPVQPRPEEPKPLFEKAPMVAAASPVSPLKSLEDARMLADRGEWEQAADICHRILNEDAINAPAHFTLALVLDHTGTPAEAQASFRRAIYLDRGFALAHYHLGGSLQRGGVREQARRCFRNVIELAKAQTPDELVAHGDGMVWKELRDLSIMHLEALGGS